jgi:hypothetical protein
MSHGRFWPGDVGSRSSFPQKVFIVWKARVPRDPHLAKIGPDMGHPLGL